MLINNILKIIWLNFVVAYKSYGKKVLLCSYRYEYFSSITTPLLDSLDDSFFIIESTLEKTESIYFRVEYELSKYIFIDYFLSVETCGIKFPARYINCKKIMAFHGLGTYNLVGELSKLKKFDLLLCPNNFFVEKLQCLVKGKLLHFGYPRIIKKVFSRSSPESNKSESQDLYYIPHWREDGSLYLKAEEIIDFAESFENKWILPHQFIFKDKKRKINAQIHINKLVEAGFKVSTISIFDSFEKDGTFLIDILSSSYAEALFLDKNVFYIDSNINDDEFIDYLRIVGNNYLGPNIAKKLKESDKGKICLSNCGDSFILASAIKRL